MLGAGEKKESQNQYRYYLRYHNAISRAIELNKDIFGGKVGKDGKEPCFEHSLRVAGYCEEILDQTMEQYHMGWLLGILHDNKEQNPLLFSEKIDWVLEDLLPAERKRMQDYVDNLTSNKTLSKGEQKRQQVLKIDKMDLIPSWIIIFDKLDNCKRFKANPCGKSKEELDGYFAVAYLIFLKARKRHKAINDFMLRENIEFFQKMGEALGGQLKAITAAENYFKKI